MDVLTMCRAAGIFPLVRKGTLFALSVPWLVYSGALVLINTYIQTLFLIKENNIAGMSGFFKAMTLFQRLYKTICIPICLYYIAKNGRQLSKYAQVLNSLSTTRISRGPKTSYESKYASYVFPYFLFCTCFDSVDETSVQEMVISTFVQFLAHFPVICIVRHFVHFVDQLNTELSRLIDDLKAFKGFASYNLAVFGESGSLVLMSDVHYSISVAAEHLNSTYAQQYFTIVSGAVGVLIVNFYKAGTHLSKSDFLYSSQQFCWIVFWMSLVATTILPAARASCLSNEFNINLSQLIAQGPNNLFVAQYDKASMSKLRVHVDFNYTVQFSCGFFELDRFLMHSIVGGICSFSVILIQISPTGDTRKKT